MRKEGVALSVTLALVIFFVIVGQEVVDVLAFFALLLEKKYIRRAGIGSTLRPAIDEGKERAGMPMSAGNGWYACHTNDREVVLEASVREAASRQTL